MTTRNGTHDGNAGRRRFAVAPRDGYSREILALIAKNNPKTCLWSRGKLRMTALTRHVFEHGLGATAQLIHGDSSEEMEAVRRLAEMFDSSM